MRRIWFLCTLSVVLTAAVASASALQSRTRTTRGLSRSSQSRRASNGAKGLSSPAAVRSHDAVLLGNQSLVASADSVGARAAEAFAFTARATGTTKELRVFVPAQNRATRLLVAVFADVSGRPGRMLSAGSARTPSWGSWTSAKVGATRLTMGHVYWIAAGGDGGSLVVRDRRGGSCKGEHAYRAGMSSLPRTWSGGRSLSRCAVSAYVEGVPMAESASTGGVEPTASAASVTPSLTSQASTASVTSASGASGDSSAASSPANTGAVGDLPPAAMAPVDITPPGITGTVQQGSTLTASPGTWTGTPAPTYSYQWQDCSTSGCTSVVGATGSIYVPSSSAAGQTVDLIVTATNSAGSVPVISARVGPVASSGGSGSSTNPPENAGQPSFSTDQAVVGFAITVDTGSWSNSPTSYDYQWERCPLTGPCADISGAISASYTPASGDSGANLVAAVTAVNSSGSNSATSAFSLPVEPSGNAYRTFYIDYNSGSDSNSGTSESSPWKHVPGSSAFTGSYTHQRGDHFIFKGDVTWPASEFPITDSSGGSSGNPDYFGVDPNWHAGSSWSRPIFNASGASGSSCSPSFFNLSAQYIVVDGIEMTGMYFGCTNNVLWINQGAANQVVNDIYAHGWTRGGSWSDINDGFKVIDGGQNNEFLNSTCSGADSANGSDAGICSEAPINRGDTAQNMPNLFLPYAAGSQTYCEVSDSRMGPSVASFDGSHSNQIEPLSNMCETNEIYSNVFHGAQGEDVFVGNQGGGGTGGTNNYYFDNLEYNPGPVPLQVDCRDSKHENLYAVNNTMVTTGGDAITATGPGTCGTFTVDNNHFIDASGSAVSAGNAAATINTATNCVQSSIAAANAQGYDQANLFAPTSSSSCTVGTGANLSAAPIPGLDLTGFARPSGAWDEGAYQFHPGSPGW